MNAGYATSSTADPLGDAERDKKEGLRIGTVARRIARECNATDQELGVYFDEEGKPINYQPWTATPGGGTEAYAPGYVYFVQGRHRDQQRGRMSQREAQVIVNAADRYGAGTSAANEYVDQMMGYAL